MIMVIYSCNKNKGTDPTTPTTNITTYPNYSQLKVGNYWVYEEFYIDTNGVATPRNIFDSCFIEKDTIINSQTYFKLNSPYMAGDTDISFLRDSLHYIINSDGYIVFTSKDFSNVFYVGSYIALPSDTICQITRKMIDKDVSVTTPAGNYITTNAKTTYNMFPHWNVAGSLRYRKARYAKNVGLVIETGPFSLTDPNYIEKRLVRFHLN